MIEVYLGKALRMLQGALSVNDDMKPQSFSSPFTSLATDSRVSSVTSVTSASDDGSGAGGSTSLLEPSESVGRGSSSAVGEVVGQCSATEVRNVDGG
jgi:hypothetical protein